MPTPMHGVVEEDGQRQAGERRPAAGHPAHGLVLGDGEDDADRREHERRRRRGEHAA